MNIYDKTLITKNRQLFDSLMENYDVLHYNDISLIKSQENKEQEASFRKPKEEIKGNENLTEEEKFNKEVLYAALIKHNELRALHNAPSLTLNSEILTNAQVYAENLAAIDELVNSDRMLGDNEIGESLFTCEGYQLTGDYVTKVFYDEIKQYNFDSPGYDANTKNFTQLIWKSTKEVGFGRALSKSGKYYFVANYYPAGNQDDLFKENVLKSS